MHLNCELLFDKYGKNHFKDNIKVLEIGPDVMPSSLQVAVNNASIEWHTLNLEVGEKTSRTLNSQLTILSAHEYNYPIEDNTYDIIISANVLEHVKKFWLWFTELKRITKVGGKIITISPISWPYHEAPVDCWRIYPDGFRALYEEIDLTDIFTHFESLEKEFFEKSQPYTPLFPWATSGNQKKNNIIKYYNLLLSALPFSKPVRVPITVAIDLISIAQKPSFFKVDK